MLSASGRDTLDHNVRPSRGSRAAYGQRRSRTQCRSSSTTVLLLDGLAYSDLERVLGRRAVASSVGCCLSATAVGLFVEENVDHRRLAEAAKRAPQISL